MITSCLAAMALAITAGSPGQESIKSPRMEEIERAMYVRMTDQVDAWFEQGDYPRSINLLKFQSALYPTDYEAVSNLGYLLESTEGWDEALSWYVWFRRGNPKLNDGALPEADFYFRRKAYARVPALLEPMIPLKPHPNAYRELAHSYERIGLLTDSKRIWETYLKLHPEDQTGKRNLDRVLSKIKGK